MGFNVRKPDFVVCNQQRRRPSFASLRSGKWLWFSKPLEITMHVEICHMQSFIISTGQTMYLRRLV